MESKTYFRILRSCDRYERINHNAKHELIKFNVQGRNGDILLNTMHTNGRKIDLSFYEHEVELVNDLTTQTA